jgi:hypothetical protein
MMMCSADDIEIEVGVGIGVGEAILIVRHVNEII